MTELKERRVYKHHDEWPEERMERLAALWNDGILSASQIGAELGVTRNAVLGKAHRAKLGPSKHQQAPARQFVRKPRAIRIRRPTLIVDNYGQMLFLKPKTTMERPKPKLRPGQSKTSPSYRHQFGVAPEMTTNERRAFLTQAVRNTAEAVG